MISPRHNLLRCSSVVILVVSFGVGISGCAQGPDDLIDDLSGTVEEREAATQELLLAKERAVEPLLQALADPQRSRGEGGPRGDSRQSDDAC
jgi:hypothetical protein